MKPEKKNRVALLLHWAGKNRIWLFLLTAASGRRHASRTRSLISCCGHYNQSFIP